MDFTIKEREKKTIHHYDSADHNLAVELSKKLKKELNELLKGVIFFGSAVRGDAQKNSDIDILLLINDLKFIFSPEVIESIRVIIENTASSISTKFHITSMHISEFWDHVRLADPIIVNILRDGVSIYDEGFFEPAQFLLESGQIRPTQEAVWSYYLRAPKTIKSAEKKLLSTIVDLYWAVMDASHSALMYIDLIPPAPHHVADMIEKYYVENKILDKKYLLTLRKLYNLAKEIGHEQVLNTSGKDLDVLMLEAKDFVKRIKLILQMDKEELLKATKLN
ncbi:MAG: nucleotidyltransferase domain-containing protein [Candidatus Woesearchaeota archaeon]